MPVTLTDLANMALSHVGVSDRIASINDKNTRARACLLFYENVRDQVLRDFDWPFARRFALLTRVGNQPTLEWLYSYRVPAEAIAVRRIVNEFGRTETDLSRTRFTIVSDDQGQLVYTDYSSTTGPVVAYTKRETDTGRFPPDFAQSVALLLAAHIAPEISKGDELKLGERALQKYDWRVRLAWANAANEEAVDLPADSRFVTERG